MIDLLSLIHFLLVELRPLIIMMFTWTSLVETTTVSDLMVTTWYHGNEIGNMTFEEYFTCGDEAGVALAYEGFGEFNYSCDSPAYYWDAPELLTGEPVVFTSTVVVAPVTFVGLLAMMAVSIAMIVAFCQNPGGFNSGTYVRFSQTMRNQLWFRILLFITVGVMVGSAIWGLTVVSESTRISLATGAILLLLSVKEIIGSGDVPFDTNHESFAKVEFSRPFWTAFVTSSPAFLTQLTATMTEAKLGNDEELRKMLAKPDRDIPVLMALPLLAKYKPPVDQNDTEENPVASSASPTSGAAAPTTGAAAPTDCSASAKTDCSASAPTPAPRVPPDVFAWLHSITLELRPIALLIVSLYSLISNTSVSSTRDGFSRKWVGFDIGRTRIPEFLACMDRHSVKSATAVSDFTTDCGKIYFSNPNVAAGIIFIFGTLSIAAIFVASLVSLANHGGPFSSGAYVRQSITLRATLSYRIIVGFALLLCLAMAAYGLTLISPGIVEAYAVGVLTIVAAFIPLISSPDFPFSLKDPTFESLSFNRSFLDFFAQANVALVHDLNNAILAAHLGAPAALHKLLANPERDAPRALALQPAHAKGDAKSASPKPEPEES